MEAWTIDDVVTWAHGLGVNREQAGRLREQEIDGRSLLRLTKHDLTDVCRLPLGVSHRLLEARRRFRALASGGQAAKANSAPPRLRLFSPEEDRDLLHVIADVCKTHISAQRIPWQEVQHAADALGVLSGRSPQALRQRWRQLLRVAVAGNVSPTETPLATLIAFFIERIDRTGAVGRRGGARCEECRNRKQGCGPTCPFRIAEKISHKTNIAEPKAVKDDCHRSVYSEIDEWIDQAYEELRSPQSTEYSP